MSKMYSDLLKPKHVKVEEQQTCHAKVSIEPLERGFGHTLGNALRRILLSSVRGCAIVDCRIEGVLHEYTTIDGVQEDVIDILLNLKGVGIIMHSKDEATLTISKKGPGVVTAGDIQLDHDIEIVDPDYVIATLTKGINFDMSLHVMKGRGYQPANTRQTSEEDAALGHLQLDASFSPVRLLRRAASHQASRRSWDGAGSASSRRSSVRLIWRAISPAGGTMAATGPSCGCTSSSSNRSSLAMPTSSPQAMRSVCQPSSRDAELPGFGGSRHA